MLNECTNPVAVNNVPALSKLEDLVMRLRAIMLTNVHGKHASYVIARKELVLPLVDEAMEVLSSVQRTAKTCHQCPLWQDAEDARIAKATVERLMKYASCDKYFPVTMDEIENLEARLCMKDGEGACSEAV